MAAPLRWVILDRVTRRTGDEDVVRRGYVTVELREPPTPTFVALAHGNVSAVAEPGDPHVFGILLGAAASRRPEKPHLLRTAARDADPHRYIAIHHGGAASPRPGDLPCSLPTAESDPHRYVDIYHGDAAPPDLGDLPLRLPTSEADPHRYLLGGAASPPRGLVETSSEDTDPLVAAAHRGDPPRLGASSIASPQGRDLVISSAHLAPSDIIPRGINAAAPHVGVVDFPDGPALVVAADHRAGLLLAFAVTPHHSNISRARLYVLHGERAHTTSIRELPCRDPPGYNLSNLVLQGRQGGYTVAELQRVAEGSACLTRITASYNYSSNSVQCSPWTQSVVEFPPALRNRPWQGHGAISHDGKVYWFDLTSGVIICSCISSPILHFHRLPPGTSVVALSTTNEDVRNHRCISLSDTGIKFAEIRGGQGVGSSRFLVWRMASTLGEWEMEATANVADICANVSYKNCGLAARLPRLLFVHPFRPHTVYGLVDQHIFSIDLRTRTVVHVAAVSGNSSHFIAWELPVFLAPGTYPRASGFMFLDTWEVRLWHLGPSDLLVSARKWNNSSTIFYLKLWMNDVVFTDLRVTEEHRANRCCRVCVRRSETEHLIVRTLPFYSSVIMVPVPDFGVVFMALKACPEYVVGPREAALLSGPQVHRGYYRDNIWLVDFIEVKTRQGSVLLLKFSCSYLETFGAQLVHFPKFHRLEITREVVGAYGGSGSGPNCTVRFLDSSHSQEVVVTSVRAVKKVPLPYIAEICRF